ncbi:putative membrane protein [Clostridium bornimense]|uniref:Putative membrane protein n=1 Tax=Clostridium bornimense TaxID=1216932 RepID=W6SJW3_9CLOT|nr:hypothetical protein [Clostridium bornimense]CDM70015.1 putative membrane protein [Clostridium bornimense]
MGAIALTFPFMVIDYIYVVIAFILWLKNLFIDYKRNGSSLELYEEQLKKAGILCCIWISGINIPYFVCMKIHNNQLNLLTLLFIIFCSIFLIKSIKNPQRMFINHILFIIAFITEIYIIIRYMPLFNVSLKDLIFTIKLNLPIIIIPISYIVSNGYNKKYFLKYSLLYFVIAILIAITDIFFLP